MTEIGTFKGYVDRGDPSSLDFVVGNFTCDNGWHDLDLSSVVPAGANAVHLFVRIVAASLGYFFAFRKNGNSNTRNKSQVETLVAGVSHYFDCFVSLDLNRKIEYFGVAEGFSVIDVVVRGWWI